MIRRRIVRVPASSANLGPGFDCMAAAVAPRLELEVSETGNFAVDTELRGGEGAREPRACGRSSACTRPTACTLHDPL